MNEMAPAVGPRPVPMTWGFDVVRDDDGNPLVVVQIASPTGVQVLYLAPEFARQVAARLAADTEAAKASPPPGIVVPGTSDVASINGSRKDRDA